MAEKKMLTLEEIDCQTALELPDRETPALVIIGCLAVCIGEIRIKVEDVDVAAAICAQVVNVTVLGQSFFTCTVRQNQ
jgi:hypothetical protein